MTLVLREALLTFRRAPLLSVLSVTTIAFSLFVVGLFGLVAVNLQQALREVAERVEIVAYLLPGTPVETVTLASKDIEAFPEVQSAAYVTEDQALARARAELVEFRDVLRELERNHRLRQIAAAVGIAVGAAFAVVAIIIIGTTIRMAVLQRSREIAIMRLVGATDGFIRRPFLLQGAIKGMLGGLVAVGLSYAAYAMINRWLIHAAFFSQEQALAIVGFGTLIGFFGSSASVGRHLRRV